MRIMGVRIRWVLDTYVYVPGLEQRSIADFSVDGKMFAPADLGVC